MFFNNSINEFCALYGKKFTWYPAFFGWLSDFFIFKISYENILILVDSFTMRLSLFSKGDTVLLLGEGNFSFSVGLHKHQLPIDITATCFQLEPKTEYEHENIEYLKVNGVLVFFNVDATKLQENPNFADVKFSKIIFNFPHVGGKMKIHLNRQLLKNFFLGAGHILSENGHVLISLCQGQGGTPAETKQRRWQDTWQVTEMAAHGDFILTNVEPFVKENFPGYECVGYRSQNVAFHLDGALVHVFSKKTSFGITDRLRLIPLPGTDILAPPIYADFAARNPVLYTDSAVSFVQKFLIERLNEPEMEIIEDVPLCIENQNGVQCEVNSKARSLRSDPTEIFSALHDMVNSSKKLVLHPGAYFRKSGSDFLTNSPVDFKFTICGKNFRSEIINFLKTLIDIFKKEHTIIQGENPLIYRNIKTGNEVRVAEFHEFRHLHYNIINAQSICEYLFQVKWREIWTDHKITMDGTPVLKPILLYPSRYEFDITLRYTKPFSDEDLMRTLFLGGGLVIERVKLVNEYSCDKWSSKCYRIAYRSLDRPVCREKAIKIHSMIGQTLENGLDVTVG